MTRTYSFSRRSERPRSDIALLASAATLAISVHAAEHVRGAEDTPALDLELSAAQSETMQQYLQWHRELRAAAQAQQARTARPATVAKEVRSAPLDAGGEPAHP